MNDGFSVTIDVSRPPEIVFERLKDVSKWWGGSDLAGSTVEVDDEFTVTHGDAHYSKQRVVEVVANRKIVWLVVESRLNWLRNDKAEWTGTRMIFDVVPLGDSSRLRFTHEGLTPDKESYSRCAAGWTLVITEWLREFITLGKAHF